MQIPYIQRKEAEAFAKIYKVDGVHIILDPAAIEFAHQYANLVLKKHVEINILLAGETLKLRDQAEAQDKPSPKIVL